MQCIRELICKGNDLNRILHTPEKGYLHQKECFAGGDAFYIRMISLETTLVSLDILTISMETVLISLDILTISTETKLNRLDILTISMEMEVISMETEVISAKTPFWG